MLKGKWKERAEVGDWIGGNGDEILNTCGGSGLGGKFAVAGISLRGKSEVKLTVSIAVSPEMARTGYLVEITIGREIATIGIGNGRRGRACFREWT